MSVLHLWHSSGWRGGENQFRLLATHLSEPWRGRLGAPAKSELSRRLAGVLPIDSIRCGGLLDLASAAAVRRLIHDKGIRLIHAHDSHGLATALVARIGLRVPVVMSRHNAFPVSSGWKYRAADALIGVSSAAAQRLAEAGVPAGKISVVHCAADLDVLDEALPERLGASADEPVALCVAAFSPEKDHRTLIEAWATVEQALPRARLYLAGSGSQQQDLSRLVAERGLSRVHFLGWREDVAALIKGADIVVLSSISEALPTSLCEAQAAGRAVVATRAGGIPETMEEGHTGLLSQPGDPSALAINMIALLGDQARSRMMGAAGASRARSLFTPGELARRHEEIYRSLLSS